MNISELTLIKVIGMLRYRIAKDEAFALDFPDITSPASRRNFLRDIMAVAELEQALGWPSPASFSV